MKNEQWTENQEEEKKVYNFMKSDFTGDYLNMYTFHFFF